FSGGVTAAKILCSDSSLELSKHWDQQLNGDNNECGKLLRGSSTLYVGNFSFYTTEEQINELFSRCGDVRNIFMGLDKIKKTACSFCFIEYYNRVDAENAMWFFHLCCLDDHIICTDWDLGFREGQQFGQVVPGRPMGRQNGHWLRTTALDNSCLPGTLL
uniref:Nuclear cap-binding protein subunit 2 n=1 Tax=Prolemur simus TaxID=1328070 RepID=A0A8C9DSY7_PROSS